MTRECIEQITHPLRVRIVRDDETSEVREGRIGGGVASDGL